MAYELFQEMWKMNKNFPYPSFLLRIRLIQVLSLICIIILNFVLFFIFFKLKICLRFFRCYSYCIRIIIHLFPISLFYNICFNVEIVPLNRSCSQLLNVLDIIRKTRDTRETINYSRYSALLLNNTPPDCSSNKNTEVKTS